MGKGEIIGILGPNGAGKTTLLRMLGGILTPTSGHIQIDQFDYEKDKNAAKKEIGYLSGNTKLYDRLFLNAPLAIVISAKTPLDGGLASANMELMVDSLGLGTYFNGFFQVAAQDNEELLKLLNIPKEKQLISCLVIGYPNVSYKRTVPREKADITWS